MSGKPLFFQLNKKCGITVFTLATYHVNNYMFFQVVLPYSSLTSGSSWHMTL